jgi:RsiW-degrading membrane proteinase PrsW (M82 family)
MSVSKVKLPERRHGWWWKLLAGGAALWVLVAIVTAYTLNSNLVPTLILLGSFLVPLTVTMFAVERAEGNLSATTLILAFFVGGIFGVLGASLLELSLKPSPWIYVAVGFIEEFVKGAILVVIGWRILPKNALQGALLGATIGAGFSAFESAGYAFNSAISGLGIDLHALVQTEMVRALLTPAGHVLWTGVLGAAIFSGARLPGRLRLTWGIVGTFVAVSLLHSLWDAMGGLSALLALAIDGVNPRLAAFGFLPPSYSEAVSDLATALYILGLVVVTAVGVLLAVAWLRRPVHRANSHVMATRW